jgi:hypothetical protein
MSTETRDRMIQEHLQNLIQSEGLTFADCIQAFGVPRDANPFAREADERFGEEGELEFDDVLVVSETDDRDGAYVMAWRFVRGSELSVRDIDALVVKKLIETALAAGFTLGVDNGEELVLRRSADADAVFKAMMTVDQEHLLVYKDGNLYGKVFLVYGNGCWGVICNYSTNLEEVVRPAQDYAELFS